MPRFTLLLLALLLFVTTGCASHSSRHANSRSRIMPCRSTPCGATITYNDMVIEYVINREPSDEYVLTGTAMPRGVPRTAKVDLAVLSIELVRDMTIFDSYSFPMIGRDLSEPLQFKKRFTPDGGFDGITFNWDVRYIPN